MANIVPQTPQRETEMPVNWYPGHMHKASKELAKLFKDTALFLEILDARFPAASSNPLRAELHESMPSIRILNKTDLADKDATTRWQEYFAAQQQSSCLLSGRDTPLSRSALVREAERLVSHAGENQIRQKQIVIAGVPNVGKSSLLNTWCGRKLAKTGNEAAITRQAQRIHLQDSWYLVDTPGMLWPKLVDQDAANLLAAFGCIRPGAIDEEEVALQLAGRLLGSHGELLQARYSLAGLPATALELLGIIARQRGALRYDEPDLHRVAPLFLGDLNSGRLGPITMELPPSKPE